ALAEPPGAQAHVLVLGHGELTLRAADVRPVAVEVAGETDGVAHSPSVRLEHPAVLVLALAQRQLQRLACASRYVDELLKLVGLAPAVELARKIHVTPRLMPACDCRPDLATAART